MSRIVSSTLEEVIFSLEVVLKEAANIPEPRLIINANAIVVEYNTFNTNRKRFERIATIADK